MLKTNCIFNIKVNNILELTEDCLRCVAKQEILR